MSKSINDLMMYWRRLRFSQCQRRLLRQFVNYGNQLHLAKERGRLRRVSQQLLLLLLTVAIITACSGTTIEHRKTLTPKPPSTPCRLVQHAMGETCIPSSPKRVVTISYEILVNTLALGVKPIGSSGSYQEWNATHLSSQYYPYLGNRVEGIKYVGFTPTPNLEKILPLKPDLILAWEPVKEVYPLLSQIAPTVIILDTDLFENWKQKFNVIAELLGKEQEAQQVWNHYNQRIKQLKTALGDRYQNQTISIASAWGENAYIHVKNSFSGSILNELGLQRPPAQNISVHGGRIDNISEEKLELLDGDILFFFDGDNNNGKAFARLQKRPLWQTLIAVQ